MRKSRRPEGQTPPLLVNLSCRAFGAQFVLIGSWSTTLRSWLFHDGPLGLRCKGVVETCMRKSRRPEGLTPPLLVNLSCRAFGAQFNLIGSRSTTLRSWLFHDGP